MKHFNWKKFSKAIVDEKFRQEFAAKRRKSFRELQKDTKINYATLSRLFSGKQGELNHVVTLCQWMKQDINDFIK